MTTRKTILAIIGSASKNSSNRKLIDKAAQLLTSEADVSIFEDLATLPHFQPEQSIENTPQSIQNFRATVQNADAIIICTPEYIFSIPSGLKNALEWCVATTIFSEKPLGIITASANGQKGHEELQLIMKTLGANLTEATTLLIRGVKGKIDEAGNSIDPATESALNNFIAHFLQLVK